MVAMTKIWTLSTCGTGGRVCSASNLIGARRKPGGRRPGNPVSRRATKNRFFVHVPSSSSSTRPALLRFFSVRVVAPRAECKRASNISPDSLICFHFESVGDDSSLEFRADKLLNHTSISEKVTFLETCLSTPPFDSNLCSFFSIFSICPILTDPRYENTYLRASATLPYF